MEREVRTCFGLYRNHAAGQQTLMSDSTDITSRSYDRAGNLASVIVPTGQALTYTYDATDNRTLRQLTSGQRVTYTYQPYADQLSSIRNPFNEITAINSDAVKRETFRYDSYIGGVSYPLRVNQIYDAAGNIAKINGYKFICGVQTRLDGQVFSR